MGDGQEMELVPVVVEGQACRLLEGVGREIEHRLGAERKMLLPARDQRLFEKAADRLAANETQMARPRGQREDALRDTACAATGSRAAGRLRRSRGGRLRAFAGACAPAGASTSTSGTNPPLASRSQPSSPQTHFWIAVSRPSGERRSARQRPRGQMRVIDSPSGVSTIWPWPARCSGASGASFEVIRWMSGCSSYGPVEFRERAMVTAWS